MTKSKTKNKFVKHNVKFNQNVAKSTEIQNK